MKRRRSAYTLVELLIVITITSTVLGTLTVTLYSLNTANRRVRDDLEQQLQLQRLTDALRTDVHQTTVVAVEPLPAGDTSSSRLTLTLVDGTRAIYSVDDEWMDRQLERDGQVVSGDQYWLPASSAEWKVDRNRDAPLVSLVLEMQATMHSECVAKTIRVDAAALPDTTAASTTN